MKNNTQIDQAIEQMRYDNVDLGNLALVGAILRDRYRITSVKESVGVKLSRYLDNSAEHRQWLIGNIKAKKDRLSDHIAQHRKKDVPARRAWYKTHSKLLKLNSIK